MTAHGPGRQDPTGPPGFVVLASGAAGSVDERTLGTVASVLAHRAPTVIRRTIGTDPIDEALTSLDGRRPVVVGGDGSLHLAVNRLLHLGLGDTPMALVPLGTGNDLARGVGLPLDPAEAAVIAAEGRALDLAVARHPTGEVVVNNAHTGLGARASRLAGGLKPRLGAVAYPVGALVAGLRPAARVLTVSVDDEDVHTGPVVAALVTLGPSAGGGHRLAPDADPTDPRLHVVVLPGGPVTGRLAVAADVLRGRDPVDGSAAHRWSGRVVRITPDGGPAAWWDVDGELREWPGEVELAMVDAAWRLLVADDA